MITKRTKVFLAVFVVVALGAYAYLYWWAHTPEHGFFDSIPALHDASESAARAVVKTSQAPNPSEPNGTDPTGPAAPSTTYRTYESSAQRFSFDVPTDWNVAEANAQGTATLCVRSETTVCSVTLVSAPEGVNVSEERSLKELRVETREDSVVESGRRVGGEDAVYLKISGNEDMSRAVVFSREGRVYTLTSSVGQEGVFDRIVTSLSFED